ncbi:hypothetical protein H4R22_003520 [Coemansia sp. RSA 1290]|nr:hypothetical protein H4R22_003520 [Coemansia sp. RSA 1290]
MVVSTKVQREQIASAATRWLTQAEKQTVEEAVSSASLNPLLIYLTTQPDHALSTSHIVNTAKTFKALADISRSLEIRKQLAQTDLALASSSLLQRTEQELSKVPNEQRAEWVFLLVQLLRSICNQSADCDEARAKLCESEAPACIGRILWLDEVQGDAVVAQAAFAAALNVALDSADCAQLLIQADAIGACLNMLRVEKIQLKQAWPACSMGLDTLCEHEQAMAAFEQHPQMAQTMLQSLYDIVQLLESNTADDDVAGVLRGARRTLFWCLSEILEKSSQARQQLCLAEDLLKMFAVLKHYSSADQNEEEEEESASANDSPNSRTIDAVSRMLVGVTGEDHALALFDNRQVQSQLLDTIRTYPVKSPLATTAVLCLGNFARTDTHCEQLVSEHSDLVKQLVHNWLTSAADVRARHAASGLLKNLCLPLPNRTMLASLGLPEAAASAIDTAVVPVQANAIGILRHLLSGPAAAETVRCLVDSSASSAFGKLLETVRTTDIDAIRCEGTRLVAATVKRIYVHRDNLGDSLQDVQAAMDSAGFDLVAPLVRLVVLDGQRHPLLQQEALVALSILAAAGRASDIVRLLDPTDCAELFPSLPSDASSEEESSEPQLAFVEVLKKLVRQDGPVWPQSALQAKSLVAQLQAATKDLAVSNGLSILRSDIVPLL